MNQDCVATCDSSNALTTDKIAYIKSIVDLAVARLTLALQVDAVVGNLVLPLLTQGCGSDLFGRASVSSVYLSPGVPNTDYVIFITGRPTMGSNVAYALDCAVDAKRRPIAGHFNWGPNQVDSTRLETQVGIALHELSHALGFSAAKFSQFNTVNQVLQNAATTTGNGATLTTTFVVTPNVVREVRDHFGCPQLLGAALEDQGGGGSMSHWEKRLFMNEYLTGSASDHPVLSRITLAAFEDSGWYKANYLAADTLIWGRKQGCSFAIPGCTPTNWKGLGYYCTTSLAPGCAPDRRAVGVCGAITQTNAIPNPYKYFQDPTVGGFETLADYCPYVQGLPAGDCLNTLNEGKDPKAALMGTSFGSSARCFPNTLSLETISSSPQATTAYGCYQTDAVMGTDGVLTLNIMIGKLWWPCKKAGAITAVGYRGTLTCPDPAEFVSVNNEPITYPPSPTATPTPTLTPTLTPPASSKPPPQPSVVPASALPSSASALDQSSQPPSGGFYFGSLYSLYIIVAVSVFSVVIMFHCLTCCCVCYAILRTRHRNKKEHASAKILFPPLAAARSSAPRSAPSPAASPSAARAIKQFARFPKIRLPVIRRVVLQRTLAFVYTQASGSLPSDEALEALGRAAKNAYANNTYFTGFPIILVHFRGAPLAVITKKGQVGAYYITIINAETAEAASYAAPVGRMLRAFFSIIYTWIIRPIAKLIVLVIPGCGHACSACVDCFRRGNGIEIPEFPDLPHVDLSLPAAPNVDLGFDPLRLPAWSLKVNPPKMLRMDVALPALPSLSLPRIPGLSNSPSAPADVEDWGHSARPGSHNTGDGTPAPTRKLAFIERAVDRRTALLPVAMMAQVNGLPLDAAQLGVLSQSWAANARGFWCLAHPNWVNTRVVYIWEGREIGELASRLITMRTVFVYADAGSVRATRWGAVTCVLQNFGCGLCLCPTPVSFKIEKDAVYARKAALEYPPADQPDYFLRHGHPDAI